MSALAWLRARAAENIRTEEWVTEMPGYEGKTVIATHHYFKGRVPDRMVYQLQDELKKTPLVSDDWGMETIRLNGQYRSDFGKCEFFHTEYKIKE